MTNFHVKNGGINAAEDLTNGLGQEVLVKACFEISKENPLSFNDFIAIIVPDTANIEMYEKAIILGDHIGQVSLYQGIETQLNFPLDYICCSEYSPKFESNIAVEYTE